MTARTAELRPLAISTNVVTVMTPHTTVLIDYRTGAVSCLAGVTRAVWLAHIAGEPVVLAHMDATTVDTLTGQLVRRGWLVKGPDHRRRAVLRIQDASTSWGTQEVPTQLQLPAPTPWHWRLAALAAVAVTLAAASVGRRSRRFARLLSLVRIGSRLPPATRAPTEHAVHAVRQAARFIPARVACLEESVSAALLLAATGRGARWCHGIATDPIRLHAWLADEAGIPIAEPDDTALYRVIPQPE